MKKNNFSTKTLIWIAMLVATSILLKSFMSIETQVFRMSFFDIPLMILGITAGPLAGLVGGFITDWMHVMFSPFAFSFNLFTLSTMLWGFIPGLVFFKKNITIPTLSIVIVITSVLAFTLNTTQLYFWFGSGIYSALPIRLLVFIVKLPIQVIIVHQLMKVFYVIEGESYTKKAKN